MSGKQKTIIYLTLLVVIGLFLFTYRLGVRGLAEPDEGRYAEIAREMVESGNWVFPRMNYTLHMHKPPMTYWLIASSFEVFGVNEFAARFPSAIAALSVVIAVFVTGRRLAGETAGFLAAITLISMPQFLGSARLAFPDMLLTCFIALGYASFIKGYLSEKGRQWFLLYWFCAGLGMMTKGPVTLLMMVAPVVLYALMFREWRLLRRMQPVNGIALFLIVSLPWYLYVSIRLPGLLQYFLREQTAERLTSEFRPVPWYRLTTVLVALSMPWFFYLIAGIVRTFRSRSRKEPADRLQYLVIIWFALTVVFFSLLRSSIPSYILPAYPAVALITGIFLSCYIGKGERHPAFIVPSVLSIVIIATLAGTLFYFRGYTEGHMQYRFLAPVGLTAAIILSVLCVAALVSLVLRRPGWHAAALALVFPGLLVLFLHMVPEIEQHLHWRVKGKHLAEIILEVEEPGDTIVMVKQYYPDTPFYLRRQVLRLHVGTPDDFPFKEHDPGYGEKVLFGEETEQALITSDKRVLLIAPKREYERMKAAYPDGLHFVEEVNRHILFSNRRVQTNTGNSRGSGL